MTDASSAMDCLIRAEAFKSTESLGLDSRLMSFAALPSLRLDDSRASAFLLRQLRLREALRLDYRSAGFNEVQLGALGESMPVLGASWILNRLTRSLVLELAHMNNWSSSFGWNGVMMEASLLPSSGCVQIAVSFPWEFPSHAPTFRRCILGYIADALRISNTYQPADIPACP